MGRKQKPRSWRYGAVGKGSADKEGRRSCSTFKQARQFEGVHVREGRGSRFKHAGGTARPGLSIRESRKDEDSCTHRLGTQQGQNPG